MVLVAEQSRLMRLERPDPRGPSTATRLGGHCATILRDWRAIVARLAGGGTKADFGRTAADGFEEAAGVDAARFRKKNKAERQS